MDAIDLEILSNIQQNSRMSITELSQKINLSRTRTTERLNALIDSKVIKRFSCEIDPEKMGLMVTAFLQISRIKGSFSYIEKMLLENPYVTEVHCVTGDLNYIAKISLPSVSELNEFLVMLMQHCFVVSSIILSSPLPFQPLDVPV